LDQLYWDTVGASYEDDIFNVLLEDRDQMVAQHIDRFAAADAIACDFGCGTGRFLPLLARRASHVHGFDLSEVCLRQAEETCRVFDNVTLAQRDLAVPRLRLPKADLALSVNVVIMASLAVRTGILRTIARHVAPGGHLLLVAPSFESALYANLRLLEWNLRVGHAYGDAVDGGLRDDASAVAAFPEGIVTIDGVQTKHYLAEELRVILEQLGFSVQAVKKMQYAWQTEFERPPKWMQEPYPWDWLAVARKQ
jgi:SAM-dependent methyltransferase